MNFLPVSILAYIFNGGSISIDKILLKKSLPNPIAYTFFVNALQLLALILIPFGFHWKMDSSTYLAMASGIIGIGAFYTFFMSLKINEASAVGPIVGLLNPVFALVIGGVFLNQILGQRQYLAFFVLILGAAVLTFNIWSKHVGLSRKFTWMALAGFLFGLSYVLLREAFVGSSFINGLIISRASAGIIVLSFLLFPKLRREIFAADSQHSGITSKTTLILIGTGQAMGGLSGFLTTYGISLASPALVNSLFGVQYLTILGVAVFLAKKNPHLLDEELSQKVIMQKIIGAIIISLGLYLLAK